MFSQLLAAGSNSQGQLGIGSVEDAHTFFPCKFVDSENPLPDSGTAEILAIASGARHTILLLNRSRLPSEAHNEVWVCGDNNRGQLGPTSRRPNASLYSDETVFRPVQFSWTDFGLQLEDSSPKLIAASWETTYIVLQMAANEDDVVLCMGSNDFGNLGCSGSTPPNNIHLIRPRSVWVDLPTDFRIQVSSIAAGTRHVLMTLVAPREECEPTRVLVGWGSLRHGELGPQPPPLKNEKNISAPAVSFPRIIPSTNFPMQVACGNRHSVVLDQSGRIYATGGNNKGQVGDCSLFSNISAIACTWYGTYAVQLDGPAGASILSAGNNDHGQLGRDASAGAVGHSTLAPVDLPSNLRISSGTLCCGSEHVLLIAQLNDIVDDMESSRTELWGWGWNEHGNLGLGHTNDITRPARLLPSESNDFTTGGDIRAARTIRRAWAGCGSSWVWITRADEN